MDHRFVLDAVTLDQLRTFVAVVEEGSFSAAGRRLQRVQSAVSSMVAALESQMGVSLFDRSGRFPQLTSAGTILLADARNVISGVDLMKSRAKGMAAGVEPELSVVIDVIFPLSAITNAARDFREQFPGTPLRLYVEALGAAYQPILDGRASLGIVGSLPTMPSSVTGERVAGVNMIPVAASSHPLASFPGMIPRSEAARHVQLVLTDRSKLSAGREFGVIAPFTWRLADLFAKHAFLLDGLGWGGMPFHAVSDDIAAGRLVVLDIEDMPVGGMVLPMHAVYSTGAPPGPAGRWFIDRIRSCNAEKDADATT